MVALFQVEGSVPDVVHVTFLLFSYCSPEIMCAYQILEDEVSNICEHYFDSSIYLHDGFSYLHLILPTRSDSSQQGRLLLSCFFVCHSLGSVRVFVLVWVRSYLLEQGQFICDFTNGENASPSPNNCKLLTFLHKGVETYMPLPHPCRNGDRPSLEQIPRTHTVCISAARDTFVQCMFLCPGSYIDFFSFVFVSWCKVPHFPDSSSDKLLFHRCRGEM